MIIFRYLRPLTILSICFLTIVGCASYNPDPLETVGFRERAQTKIENNVRVTAAVPSAQESKTIFGVNLYRKGIQPVWLEIENNDEDPVWFLPVGLDPDYFTPFEAALMNFFRTSESANKKMEHHFIGHGMRIYIGPGVYGDALGSHLLGAHVAVGAHQ